MKSVFLQLAMDLNFKKEQRDLVTGLKSRTNAGRPNWNKVSISVYLLISTHIYWYLYISTDIFTYLLISTHIYTGFHQDQGAEEGEGDCLLLREPDAGQNSEGEMYRLWIHI